jgi:hypothetical protein
MSLRLLACCLILPGLAAGQDPPPRKHTPTERMTLAHLKAVHDDVEALKAKRFVMPTRNRGMIDYRCILHAHAEDSSHTGGTLAEMLADAKAAHVHAILLTDHYRPPRDFIDGRWRGLHDDVLFIPGSEVRGFLIYPTKSILSRMELKMPEFVETVTADGGMIFLSHTEERKDHPLDGLTGVEITNRHYDAKRDPASLLALAVKLTDPKGLAEMQEAVKKYPDELFAFQGDYPKVYLEKWDEGTKTRRLTGVAANDCHHNQVLVVKMVDAETVLIGTNVDEDKAMRKLTADARPSIKEMTKGHAAGDVLVKLDVDPYRVSFKNAATHVLAPKLDEESIRAALRAGHAYVAHEWIADATGFMFRAEAVNRDGQGVMGDSVKLGDGPKLIANLPVPAYVRLLRYGKEVAKDENTAAFEFAVKEPGAYRIEAWVKLDGEHRPWIYSHPIYVR